jgi:DNA-binding transcriptional LysR family regulator
MTFGREAPRIMLMRQSNKRVSALDKRILEFMKSVDRFELMQIFVRIAETGSLTAAARSLRVSQPSASRRLKQLESLLGVQLIRRSTHRLTLTNAGRQFLEDARSILAEWDNAAEFLKSERNELRGPIRIAAPVGLGQALFAKIASQFLRLHPAVSFDWRLTDEPIDMVAGGYDLWIRAGPVEEPSLVVKDLCHIKRTVVAAAESPPATSPADLETRAAVLQITYVGRETTLKGPKKQTRALKLNPAFITDNLNAAIVAVTEGVGYAILPIWAVQDDLKSGRLVELCPAWKPSSLKLSIAYPTTRYRPVRINAFIEYLQNEIPHTGGGIVATL